MQTSDFHYDLPLELIAEHPVEPRSASRLLCLDRHTGAIQHRYFRELETLLKEGDLLVFNDTRVIPARLFGYKESGGRIELLVERVLPGAEVLAQLRASKTPRPGTRLLFANAPVHAGDEFSQEDSGRVEATVLSREGDFFRVAFDLDRPLLDFFDQAGHMPLPPYIKRQDQPVDRERYQTVYSRVPGAVAAPTAGLHFDQHLLDSLSANGIQSSYVTLHVGAGTFQPVRVADIESHRMHSEWINVPQSAVDAVRTCRKRGGRVVAVGTTSVRSLETAALGGELQAYTGETEIFIYPGFQFRVVDALITNFHLPESTLLMLVSALAGKEKILGAYREAVDQRYRFFSYGDAMFIS